MRKISRLIVATIIVIVVAVAPAMADSPTISMAVTFDSATTTLSEPGCLNFDGTPGDFEISLFSGAFVSNGRALTELGWSTLTSSGLGIYSLGFWGAFHICLGTDLAAALAELAKIDPGGAANPQRQVVPTRDFVVTLLPLVSNQ